MRHNKLYPVFKALTVALGGFLLGFDGVVNGGAVPFYRVTFGISDQPFLIGLSSGSIILGAIFGNFSVGFLIDRVGRKPALIMTSLLFMAGAAGTALAPNVFVFIIFKLIAGVGVGIAILSAPMYIAEIAPPRQRGWLVTFNQLNIVLGLSVALLSNYFVLKTILDPDMNWRWMLGIGFFPAALYFVLLFLVPESPRWLIQKGHEDEGFKILRKSCGDEADSEFENIKRSISDKRDNNGASLKDLFGPQMRFVLFLGVGLAIFQQLSGINAVLYYAPMIFESAGSQMDAAFLMAIVVGLVFTASTIVSMFLIDRLGRRPLLIIGSGIMAVSFFVVSYSFDSGTYYLDQTIIEDLKTEIRQIDIANQARLDYPGNYLMDSTAVSNQEILLFQEQKLIGTLDLTRPKLQQSEADILILGDVLASSSNKVFDNETDFFETIRADLIAQHNDDSRIQTRFAEIYKPVILKASISIDNVLILLGILGFITGFSISLGPVMWAMFSEIFPNRLRAKAIATVGALNGFTSFFVATIFPVELEYLGSAGTYFIFGACMLLCLGFVLKYIPETKGKTLEELETELMRS